MRETKFKTVSLDILGPEATREEMIEDFTMRRLMATWALYFLNNTSPLRFVCSVCKKELKTDSGMFKHVRTIHHAEMIEENNKLIMEVN